MRRYFPLPWISVGFVSAVLAGMMACSTQKSVHPPLYSGRNVILISIDTCRADHIQPYNDAQAQTPAILALARDGVWFQDAVTPVPLTLPSHTTMLTGLHPMRHGVRDNYNCALGNDAVTLAELFQESGYATAGVIGSILLSRQEGLSQGFDFYDDQFTPEEFNAISATVERKAERVISSATGWLETHLANDPQKPFFLFIHLYDPHMQYHPPAPFDQEYPDSPYNGEIAYVDHWIGKLIGELKGKKLYDDLMMMLVADHGEGLYDHGDPGHGLFLYEEAVHVPLIVKLPFGKQHPQGIPLHQSASLEDLTPTLIELCGLGPVETTGMSLAPWLAGNAQPQQRNLVLETQYPLTYNWSPTYALRNARWKYIHAPMPEMYDLVSDPKEKKNLFSTEHTPLQSMQNELENRLVTMASKATLAAEKQASPDRMELLASLGYAAGGPQPGIIAPDRQLPDPKAKLEVYILVDQGLAQLAHGSAHKSIETFQRALVLDPNNPTPYMNLGLAYAKVQQWDDAIQYSRLALDLNPQNLLANLQLTRIYINRDKLDEAKKLLDAVLHDFPRLAEAHFQMGELLRKQGKFDDALKEYELAKTWMPDMPGIDEMIHVTKEGEKN